MISIIVPVYNVEKYLERCIESILSQTYNDFEVILVDDGSKDNSPQICDEYEKKDNRIKVIHQENGGLSVARNSGIDAAVGDYITYIDSDDFIHPKYLEILNNLIIKNNAQIACSDFKFYYDNDSINFELNKSEEYTLDGVSAASGILYGKFHGTSANAILMKSSIPKKYKFTPNRFHEDDLVTFKYYLQACKVVFTKEQIYYYYQRDGSIMHTKYGKQSVDKLNASDYIVSECRNIGVDIYKASIAKQFDNYNQVIYEFPKLLEIDSETFYRIKKVFNEIKYSVLMNKNISKKNRIRAFFLIIFGIQGLIFINKFLKI